MGRTPRFQVYAPLAASLLLFGFVGAAVESSLDERRLGVVGVHDPAEAIAEAVVDGLAKRFSLTVLDASDLDQGLTPHLMVRVQTIDWGVRNAATGGVGISYEGTMELTDTRTHEVLARAMCVRHPVEGQSVGALAANRAAMVRDELRGVAEYCADDYRHRILGLY